MSQSYSIPGIYRRPKPRAEGFPRVRTDVAGFVGAAGPRHIDQAVAVNDWKSYVAEFRQDADGEPVDAPAGGALEKAVRDFFANGGRRLWIVNIAERIDEGTAQVLFNKMLGLGESLEPHGLELLLRQREVSIVALPDLDAGVTVEEDRYEENLPPAAPCFTPCQSLGPLGVPAGHRAAASHVVARLYSDDDVFWAQQYLIERLERTRWRWFALLAPPPGKTVEQAVEWRERLTARMGGSDLAALYWPWLMVQDSPGAPVETRSPLGAMAGIFAEVDVTDGPHVAPANRVLTGVVGLETPVSDRENRRAYEAGVNVLRSFAGRGINVWGARTLKWISELSAANPLSFINARRCLSAIARTAEVVGQPLVFEPNTPLLRIRLHQLMTGYLLTVFQSGALMGAAPEEGFFVQVDTVEESEDGHLMCRIGVALAAPAEFIEFRIGREGGVIETAEAA